MQPLVARMPELPGVYHMLDDSGAVLYVGKARNLRSRLRSYLGKNLAPKTERLMAQVVDIQVTVAESDSAALLLEDATIKRFKPKYNILLRDDKSYPYLYLSTQEAYPRLQVFRGQPKGKGRFFGPFANAKAVRESFLFIQKTFRLRQCTMSEFSRRSRPCIQHQIGCCTAPCVNLVTQELYQQQVDHAILFLSGDDQAVIELLEKRMLEASESRSFEQAATYRDQVAMLRHVTQSSDEVLINKDVDVIAYAGDAAPAIVVLSLRQGRLKGTAHYYPQVGLDEEKEVILTQFLQQYYLSPLRGHAIPNEVWLPFSLPESDLLGKALKEHWSMALKFSVSERGHRQKWCELAKTNAEQALATRSLKGKHIREQLTALSQLLGLEVLPNRIECIDISHTQGEETVGGVVVFEAGAMDTAQYRRYRVSSNVTGGDDYAAIREVVNKRIASLKKRKQPWPDIFVIDGGKGQLSQAAACFSEEFDPPFLLGMSKGSARKVGEERLWLLGESEPLTIPRAHPARLILERIRDEAHRCAIGAHRVKRDNSRKRSILESVPGIGRQKQQALYQHFGGLTELKAATIEQIAKVPGIGPVRAKSIFEFLHKAKS